MLTSSSNQYDSIVAPDQQAPPTKAPSNATLLNDSNDFDGKIRRDRNKEVAMTVKLMVRRVVMTFLEMVEYSYDCLISS